MLAVVDCSEHMSTMKDKEQGKEYVPYICNQFLPHTMRLDPTNELFHCLVLDGAQEAFCKMCGYPWYGTWVLSDF